MPKIILDTNIYLNFYRLDGGQSVEMLKNLNKFIEAKNGKFKLILPRQIEDEFIREKNSGTAIYGDHILNFKKGLEIQFKIPSLIKSSQKIEQINKVVKKLNTLREQAFEDYKNRVFNPNSKINQQLGNLFSNAVRPPESDSLLQRAWFRTLRGNPPRKNNSSFGDAIIWETILDQCTDEDLILISGDGDFESEIKKGDIHELLSLEWANKSNKKLTLYKQLGTFINEHSKTKKKPPIDKETIKEEERLNSAFSLPFTTLSDQVMYQGLNLSDSFNFNEGRVTFPLTSGTIGNRKCTCCGAQVDLLNTTYSVLGETRCENCRYTISPGFTCSKCGRHFHREVFTVLTDMSLCDECQKLNTK